MPRRVKSYCATWADIDGDQRQDFLIGYHGRGNFPKRGGICRFYTNSAEAKGITLVLKNPDLSPHGLGAQVQLYSAVGTQTRQVHSVCSYHNSTVLPLHFGLGSKSGPWRGVVTWRDGSRQEFTIPRSGAAYLLQAGEEHATELS